MKLPDIDKNDFSLNISKYNKSTIINKRKKLNYFSLFKIKSDTKSNSKINIKNKSNSNIKKNKIFKEIDLYNYKRKLEKYQNNKKKSLKYIKNMPQRFSKFKNYDDKNNTKEIKTNINHNLIYLNREVINKILVNKLKKYFDKILKNSEKNLFQKALHIIESYINEDNNFFEEIKRSVHYHFLNFKKKLIVIIEKNDIIKNIIYCFQKLYKYVNNKILTNFKFIPLKGLDNNVDIKYIFTQVSDMYSNTNNTNNNKQNTIKENIIKEEFWKYKTKLKNFKLIKDKIKEWKTNKKELKNLLLILKKNENLNITRSKIKRKSKISGYTWGRKSEFIILNKNEQYQNQLFSIKNDLKSNKSKLKQLKIEIKIEKYNLKKKLIFNIINNYYFKEGIIYYLKIFKFIEENVDLEKLFNKNKIINIEFLKNLNNNLDLIKQINYKRKKSYFNKTKLKKKFNQVLGFNYDRNIKLKDLKSDLIKNFVFKSKNSTDQLSKTYNKRLTLDNENLLNLIANSFNNEINRLYQFSLKFKDENYNFFNLLCLYFGKKDSQEIYFNYKKLKKISFITIFNYSFFNQFINNEIN